MIGLVPLGLVLGLSLQERIERASPGDTLRVEAGVYEGNLVLDKPLTLEGVGRPVLRGSGRGSVVTVTAPGCVLRNLRIERSGGMLVDEDSGILLKSRGNRLENNELDDVLFGIYLLGSDHNVIAGNVIRGRARLELGERGSGIHIWNSSDNLIERNRISLARDGMYLQNANRSRIRGNRIFELRYGLHYMFSDDNVFEDNVFENNVAGAAIMYSRRIILRRNRFVRNRGFSSFGALFQDSDECLAEDNVFADNAVGIFLEALRGSLFRRNLIAANDVAIQAFASAVGNTFEGNDFFENLSPLTVVGRETGMRWRANYWSDYEGYDLDGDGRGDVPHKIQNVFERLEGNHPRLRLYLFSPASQALAAAEKAFPILQSSRELDPEPLMNPAAGTNRWLVESQRP